MRRLAGLFMLIGIPATASAHEVAGDASVLQRIGHEFVGLHHLPVTITLVVACILLYRMHSGKASRRQ